MKVGGLLITDVPGARHKLLVSRLSFIGVNWCRPAGGHFLFGGQSVHYSFGL
jgi:hypothetical protein